MIIINNLTSLITWHAGWLRFVSLKLIKFVKEHDIRIKPKLLLTELGLARSTGFEPPICSLNPRLFILKVHERLCLVCLTFHVRLWAAREEGC